MRVLIEDYWRKLHYEGGYEIVFTPHIGRANLWETSGHLDFTATACTRRWTSTAKSTISSR